jgi:hypothetical protein
MKGKGAGHDEHGRGVEILEDQIAHELGLDDRADVCNSTNERVLQWQ